MDKAQREDQIFEPFRPMLENPSTRDRSRRGRTTSPDPIAQSSQGLFNSSYGLMLMMLARFSPRQ